MNYATGEYRRIRNAEERDSSTYALIIVGIVEIAIAAKIIISLVF